MRLAVLPRDLDILNRLVPAATGVIAAILSVVPLHVSAPALATPLFALMTIYHWSVYRPDLMTPAMVFGIGLTVDLLDGTPYIGLSALTFLIARSMILLSRRRAASHGFASVWAGFFAICAATVAMQWLAVDALSMTLLSPQPFAFQIVVTVAVYPIVDYLLGQAQRHLLRRP